MAVIIICIVLAVFLLGLGSCVVAGLIGLRNTMKEQDIVDLLGEEGEE